jgi:SAM-dependent methyltransferase
MRIIFVDHPEAGAKVGPWQVFDGWTISSDTDESVTITINERPVNAHRIPRPDVEAAHPGCNAKGFMFFLEPEVHRSKYRAHLQLGNVERDIEFVLEEDDLLAVRDAHAALAVHEAFFQTALACPKCLAPVSPSELVGRIWTCAGCSEVCDCRRGLDLIPNSYANKADIRFQGAICSHPYDGEVEAIIERVAAAGGMVLDCGAGWRHRIRSNVVTTEILRYPSTDIIAVGEHLPFRDNVFDAVLSLHVLEHVKNPFVCAAELVRVLKPSGTLYAVTPYIVGVHGFPFHFFNPTQSGLQALFEGKITNADVSVPLVAHPLAALKDLLGVYVQFFDPLDLQKFRSTTIGELVDSSFDAILSGDLVKGFHEKGKSFLAGNYRITGTKG